MLRQDNMRLTNIVSKEKQDTFCHFKLGKLELILDKKLTDYPSKTTKIHTVQTTLKSSLKTCA